ncbi:SufE family protein [Pseudoroseicyclus aestuarii]|uniref:Cysteine desulfuration protein SufE n=1 Tax=Pseudoroseicyclus aestuarii TaxID=1795041 RepID=A0A318T244_9RHOB|nr:SufE family protein [Pseudoroseicyclus aestuarii]PYE86057.1 cysteine desulfuration protein SufE [Pseudoroseicyclus aestuarii]
MASPAFEAVVEDFEFLGDWEERYRHVIEMGRAMDPLEDALKVPATKVQGCASQVWLVPRVDGEGPEAVYHFAGDSDAQIVRGLIAVLQALYDGQPAEAVVATDAPVQLARLGLDSHLSSQRSNGLRAMVQRIRETAAAAAAAA